MPQSQHEPHGCHPPSAARLMRCTSLLPLTIQAIIHMNLGHSLRPSLPPIISLRRGGTMPSWLDIYNGYNMSPLFVTADDIFQIYFVIMRSGKHKTFRIGSPQHASSGSPKPCRRRVALPCFLFTSMGEPVDNRGHARPKLHLLRKVLARPAAGSSGL